ncbi:probable protein phosphatase 2C 6 isoform X1 [Cucurbita pepo subsp. pepo]|uniref:probable protein phosphatase 2C 6 isoform X1 n=1 Tax=Cucurbita pepo subsp. pepo TaxID=3664 RepID=UPI000C9D89DA|nr:probable protein phosphatase 2C 6 isoform X1 [Cucurbita pepo subsp. pepo]
MSSMSAIDNERGSCEISWGFGLDKGCRTSMEDAIAIVPEFLSPARWKDDGSEKEKHLVHYFGLFDGHGGPQVSTYCSKKFHELLAEEWNRGVSENGQQERWKMALTRSYERVDDAFKDKTLAPYSVGSTALVVLLSACQIIVANCGDSRALLCRGNQAIPLTIDHKISRPDEYDRLIKGGAKILFVGCPRVEGVLAMTRAIGDHYLKPWIIFDPEVTFTSRTEEDECLILASDGVWDVLSNDDVMKMACSVLKRQRKKLALGGTGNVIYPAQCAANKIRKEASNLSGDNISVIVVDLKAPNEGSLN